MYGKELRIRAEYLISPLLENPTDQGSLKFEVKENANILLDQFCSVFTQEKGSVPMLDKRTDKSIKDLIISEDSVKKEILALNTNKSSGPDEINFLMLIKLVDYVTKPITMLMNSTIQHGTLPDDWKRAVVSPIYKKGSQNLAENYRPISLTSIVCKLTEKFLKKAVLDHLIENDLLSKKQYGFISGRSTVTQLLMYIDECADIIAKGGIVDIIYFNFSKVFDTVPHQRLSVKMIVRN